MKYNTIIISDLHLGSKASRKDDILGFLENLETNTLILNGDIIDGWSLARGSKWTKKDSKIIRKILKISETGTDVIWIRGNHDDFLKEFLPFYLGNIKIVEDYIHQYNQTRYYIFHGDVLDIFITKIKWLAYIGSIGYDIALWINRWYNKWRSFRGLPYYSISNDIKKGIKKATNFINDFEDNARRLAYQKGCTVAICGHIHHPAIKDHYLNSGDWCENCTALAELKNGDWKLISYHSSEAVKSK
jgi:UDP-2,3-diacylglucosamine pyrophosphatase LpxH